MSIKIKHFKNSQLFNGEKLVTFLYRKFPKFKGYWHFLKILAKFLPYSMTNFSCKINLDGKIFSTVIDIRDPYQISVFAENKKELCVPALFSQILKPGDFYLDIGANAGWYVRLMAEVVGPDGLIIGMEPSRKVYTTLSRLKLSNFIPLPYAATITNGQIVKDNSGLFQQSASSTFIINKDVDNSETDIVGRSVDHILSSLNKTPKIIKIDVEGAELNVLKGALKTVEQTDYVLIEINDNERCNNFGYDFQDIYLLMKNKGFKFKYDVRNSNDHIYLLEDNHLIPGDIFFSRIPLNLS